MQNPAQQKYVVLIMMKTISRVYIQVNIIDKNAEFDTSWDL